MSDPTMPNIEISPTPDALAERAAALILEAAREAITAQGRFTIALTGGSSPVKACELLAQVSAGEAEWDKWVVFLGDERFVPPDDDRSNFGQARRTLLSHVPIPAGQIYAVPTDTATPAEAAALYAETLSHVFTLPVNGPPPVFDLILLGMGDDGHTASLFPGMPTLNVTDRWVVSSPPGTLPPPVDRVTFTFPVLSAACRVLFLVTGEKKASPVDDILEGRATRDEHPAEGVKPVSGTLTWLLDEAAASLLTKK